MKICSLKYEPGIASKYKLLITSIVNELFPRNALELVAVDKYFKYFLILDFLNTFFDAHLKSL